MSLFRNDGLTKESTARFCACAWLHNPLVMNVSTRGSAESVIVALVLLTIHLYQQVRFMFLILFFSCIILFSESIHLDGPCLWAGNPHEDLSHHFLLEPVHTSYQHDWCKIIV